MRSYLPLLSLSSLIAAFPAAGWAQATPDAAVVLDPYEITAESQSGYISHSVTASGRIAQQLEDIPQTVVVLNHNFISDMGFSNPEDIFNYVSGATPGNAERYGASTIIRGFDTGVPLKNGFSQGNQALPNIGGAVEDYEQVEVIKGAAGALYGQSNPGGLVNYVTKNPLFKRSTEVSGDTYFLHGTEGYRVSIDTTGPVPGKLFTDSNGNSTLAYRFVATRQYKYDWQLGSDRYVRNDDFGKLTWRPLPGLTIQGEFEYLKVDNSDPGRLYIPTTENGKPNTTYQLPSSFNESYSYNQNPNGYNGENVSWQRFAQLSARYTKDFERFGEWTVRLGYSYNGYYERRDRTVSNQPRPVTQADLGNVVNFTSTVTQADITAGRIIVPFRQVAYSVFAPDDVTKSQLDLTGKVHTGPISHQLLIGAELDLGARNSHRSPGQLTFDNRAAYGGQANTGPTGAVNAIWLDSPVYNPINVNWDNIQNAANPNGTVIQTFAGAPSVTGSISGRKLKFDIPGLTRRPDAYYFFDNIGFFNDKLLATFGVRHDSVFQTVNGAGRDYDNTTYRYGGVLKLFPWLHLYGVHSESFVGNDPNASNTLGYIVPPQEGKQNEGGIRLFSPDKKISAQVAVYDITSSNLIVSNLFAIPGGPVSNNYIFINGVHNRGYDVDLTYNLNSKTQIIAGYAHYDISQTPTPAQQIAFPAVSKVPVASVAPNQVTAFGKYTPQWSVAPGLDFILGYRWIDNRPGPVSGITPVYFLPRYSIVDGGVGYSFGNWSTELMVRNLADKHAYRAAVNAFALWPENPRTATLSVKYHF